METLKTCIKCGGAKPLNDFHLHPKTGVNPICKKCMREYSQARYLKKKDEIKAQVRAWQSLNPEKPKEYKAKWNIKHRSKS